MLPVHLWAGAWGLLGGVAAAVLRAATDFRDAQRYITSKSVRFRLLVLAVELLGTAGGVALVALFSWQWALRALGWIAVSVGSWTLTGDALLYASFRILPPKPSPDRVKRQG